MTLTIGKSFLNDYKRAQNSQKKLEKLLKMLTLTIGTLFLDGFNRAQLPTETNMRNFSVVFFRIFGPEIMDFWFLRGVPSPRSIAEF